MLTKEQNARLTRVGRGTPAGELLRRYWHPIAGVSELRQEPVQAVRLLGEDLVLYRDRRGCLGLLAAQCPHRKVSLAYGIPEEEGLRCCYHGWRFDERGRCLEQPAEPPESNFKDRVRQPAYPVQELGGLVWAYLGPSPAPLLPRYDVFAWEDAWRDIGRVELPCNWLQIMENSVDPTHTDYLHGRYYDYALERQGRPPLPASERRYAGAQHVKIGFDLFEHGIVKRRVLEGGSEESSTWQEGVNPVVFPTMVRSGGRGSMQIRVPMDDEHTLFFYYTCYRPNDGLSIPEQPEIPVYRMPLKNPDGRFIGDWIMGQDLMAWVMQGAVMDRTTERLGASDRGVLFFRQVLEEQVERVAAGQDPLAVIRDPAKNRLIELKLEENGPSDGFRGAHWHRFSPMLEDARALMTRSAKPREQETLTPALSQRERESGGALSQGEGVTSLELAEPAYRGGGFLHDRWMESVGIPIYRGFYIEDLRTLELGWWEERQCHAAFIQLDGQQGIGETRVSELAPGAATSPLRLAFDEVVYVLEGVGATVVWPDDGSERSTFEWQKHSLFRIPHDYGYQLFNAQGNRPARLLHYNLLPLAMSVVRNPARLINPPADGANVATSAGKELYAEAKPVEATAKFFVDRGIPTFWYGNFFPDMRAWDSLVPLRGRGAGGRTVFLAFPGSEMSAHMSAFPAGTYKRAHRHGPGFVLLIPAGEGFSIFWPEGGEKIVVPWHEGTMMVPPNRWFHQHFNVADAPARYLALHPAQQFARGAEKVQDRARDQIDYTMEEPWIRAKFESELAQRGLTPAMPTEAYEMPDYQWRY